MLQCEQSTAEWLPSFSYWFPIQSDTIIVYYLVLLFIVPLCINYSILKHLILWYEP
jgi:hypothetical protein